MLNNKLKFSRCKSFNYAVLAISIAVAIYSINANAEEKLDMSFIQGGNTLNPEMWDALNGSYPPGRYLVNVSLNGKDKGKSILDVTSEENQSLCLTEAWLNKSGVYINKDYFKHNYDANRQCYMLAKAKDVNVDFDVSTQNLSLTIPQRGLQKKPESIEWDYGSNAFRMNYNINGNTGNNYTAAYGTADLKANVGKWVVSSSATATYNESGENEASIDMFTATRAIRSLSADLSVGKTSTGDNILGSSGTYGFSLSRNNNMKPGNLGYSPVFSGIANGPSRVTLTQNGRTLYSEMVPAGPFSITDVVLYNSGDVTMKIIDDDNNEQEQIFPLTVISGQLSSGQQEFNISAGLPDEDSPLKGGVFAASYGYGFNGFTLRAGTVANQDWQGSSAGITAELWELGAVSLEGAFATLNYKDGKHSGNKVQLSWSKQLTSTNTGFRASWSRQSEQYESISSFDPEKLWHQENYGRKLKDEISIGINQPLGKYISFSVSGWQRSYYPAYLNSHKELAEKIGQDRGVTGTLSSHIKDVSINLGFTGSQNVYGKNNWTASASVSVPFTVFDRNYRSSTSISTGNEGKTNFSTGIYGALNDRFSYGFGGGNDGSGGISTYINASYTGDKANINGALNKSSSAGTSASLSASGSLLAVPTAKDIIFSNSTSDTIAVVSVKDTPGVKVTSGGGKTNNAGNVVVPLNSYEWNTVTIDAASLPLNTELSNTSKKIVPTDKAVVWMPFEALRVQRYLLQVKKRNGEFIPGGTWARDNTGTPLGFVANNGVLMINAVDQLGDITLGQCKIPSAKLKETDKIQEITCE
ncbi:PefC/AfrB family outer membrane usher protein [Escherichia coli B12:H4]